MGVLRIKWLGPGGAAALVPAPVHAADVADAGGISPFLLLVVLVAILPLLFWARHRLRQIEAERAELVDKVAMQQAELGSLPRGRYRWPSNGTEDFEPGPIEALAGGTAGFRSVLLRFAAP